MKLPVFLWEHHKLARRGGGRSQKGNSVGFTAVTLANELMEARDERRALSARNAEPSICSPVAGLAHRARAS